MEITMNFLTNSTYQSDIRQAAGIDFPWELLEGKRILLTGATGMIASVIIDILMSKDMHNSSEPQCRKSKTAFCAILG